MRVSKADAFVQERTSHVGCTMWSVLLQAIDEHLNPNGADRPYAFEEVAGIRQESLDGKGSCHRFPSDRTCDRLHLAQRILGVSCSQIPSVLVAPWAYPTVTWFRFDVPGSHPVEDEIFQSNLSYWLGVSPVRSTHRLWIALGSTPGLLIGRLLRIAPNYLEISIARRDLHQDRDGKAGDVDGTPPPAGLTAKNDRV